MFREKIEFKALYFPYAEYVSVRNRITNKSTVMAYPSVVRIVQNSKQSERVLGRM